MTKKELTEAYKERQIIGGIFKITNSANHKFLLGNTADIKSFTNRYRFAQNFGKAPFPKLQNDWEQLGSKAFGFEILEQLEKNPIQSDKDFLADLKILELMWLDKFNDQLQY